MPRYYCDYCDAYLTHDSVGCEMVWLYAWGNGIVCSASRYAGIHEEAGSL